MEPDLQISVKEIPHGWHWQGETKAPAGTDWRWCVGTGLSHVPWDRARAKPTDFPSNQPLTKRLSISAHKATLNTQTHTYARSRFRIHRWSWPQLTELQLQMQLEKNLDFDSKRISLELNPLHWNIAAISTVVYSESCKIMLFFFKR